MSEAADQLKQRLGLLLRAERAMGALGVPFLPIAHHASESTITGVGESESRDDMVTAPREEAQVSRAKPQLASKNESQPAIDSQPALIALPEETKGVEFGPHRPAFESPVLPRERKIELLTLMDANEVKGCVKCELCKTRTNTVFGEGDPDARLMFIGEGPGENEDLQGRPFIGKAGDLLNKMIGGMGLRREQVFIVNIVKCRPPNNRVPAPEEVATCTPYLERQIEIIRPSVIVTLGLPSTQYMLQSKLAMGKMRGVWQSWRGIKLMPTYHPAYVLRSYTEQTRAAVWSDLQQVMSELGLAVKRKPRADA